MSCSRVERLGTAGTLLSYSKDRKIAYHVLDENRLDDALNVLVEGFYPDEPVCSLYFHPSEDDEAVRELNLLMAETAKDRVSVIAVNTQTHDVVGVCFNKIQIKTEAGELPFFEKFKRACKNTKTKSLIDYMSEIDQKVDVFETFNVDKVVELVFLAVAPSHRHRGIGLELVAHSLEYVKSKSIARVACMIGTSSFTQRIGEKLNFKNLVDVPYKRENTIDEVFDWVVKIHDRSILFAKQV